MANRTWETIGEDGKVIVHTERVLSPLEDVVLVLMTSGLEAAKTRPGWEEYDKLWDERYGRR